MKFVLFVCTENSARSQMSEAFFNYHNDNPGYIAISAGTHPSDSIKPFAIQVMKEKGIVIPDKKPKILTLGMAQRASRIFTMGCIDSCPLTPPKKTEDWHLEDPSGKTIEKYREIRDEIEKRVKRIILELS